MIAKAAAPSLFDADAAKEFHFSDFPALNKSVDEFIEDMGKQLQLNVEDGDSDAWTLANAKNDMVVNTLASVYSIPKDTLKAWRHPHLDALQQFEERRKNGMNLSNGGSAAGPNNIRKVVWNLDQFKNELELALEQGIGQGKSAADLSRDVRQYLKYPNKLLRKVRDKDGVLRLSKAAAAFHPGRGVYRSSYKNALRLTATENNIAYRTCDHLRWNALPFVLGQEIKTSNNHTLHGKPFTDICDDLAGRYPKEFKFTGWHPFCRCYAVSILANEKELDEYCRRIENGEDTSSFKFSGKQTEMPEAFTKWVKGNEARIASAKSMPYFLKDNERYWKVKKGNTGANAPKAIPISSVKQVKDYSAIKAYENGGRVHVHKLVSDKDSDYKKLVDVADFFAKQGKEVRLTPKKQRTATFNYDSIYGSLKGTKYYGKCPDLRVGDLWYEHEGFVSKKAKNAFRNMLNDGLKQSDRLIIDKPKLEDAYMKRIIRQRVSDGQHIREVWLKDGREITLLFKKSEE